MPEADTDLPEDEGGFVSSPKFKFIESLEEVFGAAGCRVAAALLLFCLLTDGS